MTLAHTATDDEVRLARPLETTTDGDATAEDDISTEDTEGLTDVILSIARLELTATVNEPFLARLLETTTDGDATAKDDTSTEDTEDKTDVL